MSDFGLPDPEYVFELKVEDVLGLAPAIAEGTIQLIDCREQDEWDFNHLPHAQFAPLSNFPYAAEAIVAEGKPCVVYCHHGIRSLRAADWLRSKGLQQAWSMTGGIDLWSERIDPGVPKY
ncbi:rhodanese-like domain-containing protein [Haloferula chungangensis]|uniref:Rhodanese-like domain-containing protein n=1 Tax=Haloferula chungangensis TaxID=1048331 RepID=A0ABW2L6G0_9BACT